METGTWEGIAEPDAGPARGAAWPEVRRAAQAWDAARVTASPLLRAALCLFTFTFFFEAVSLPGGLDPTLIATGLLLLASLLQPRLCYRLPPSALWLFSGYLYVCLVLAAVAGAQREVFYQLFVHAHLVVLCWIAMNVMRDERAARGALLSLVAGACVMTLLALAGFHPADTGIHKHTHRLTFGLDPNQIGALLGASLLALLGLSYGVRRSLIQPRFLAWPLFALLAVAMVKTGSRGVVVALGAGLLVLLLRGETVWIRLRNLLIVLAGLGIFAWAVTSSDLFMRRMENTIDTGDLSLREWTYPIAWKMFLEKPITGWGTFSNTLEIGRRLAHPAYPRMDTHNLLLYLLTSAGVVGALPFVIGILLCLRAAWKGRDGPHGTLPLALLTTLLVSDMSVSGMHWKQHWFLVAYALASATWLATLHAGETRRQL